MTEDPSDRRLRAPASTRNQGPILDVLRARLPPSGQVLEVASGTGEHVVHFAAALPGLVFQPSDLDARCRESVAAWVTFSDRSNIRPVKALDVTGDWTAQIPGGKVDAVLCINMIHIAPWEATLGLVDGASRRLHPGGVLFLYGPFMRDGAHTAPTNAVFDARLRAQDASWGIRDLGDVVAVATAAGFNAQEVIEMPANNLSVLFGLPG
jgi:SAM-dependent methyltransferase